MLMITSLSTVGVRVYSTENRPTNGDGKVIDERVKA